MLQEENIMLYSNMLKQVLHSTPCSLKCACILCALVLTIFNDGAYSTINSIFHKYPQFNLVRL